MRWLELSVEADAEAVEAVSEILGRVSGGTAVRPTRLIRDPEDALSAQPDLHAPFVVTGHLADVAEASQQVEATERALWHLQAFGLGRVGELAVRPVEDSDWTDAWRRHYVAQRIGRVVVMPSWAVEPLRDGEVAVILDPGMAFGTGLHPTTRACLELIQEVRPMPPAVLDVGAGSGILGIAALRLGAERVVALDTDPEAVSASAQNAARNMLGERLDPRRGSLDEKPSERYRLVVANLVAGLLVDLAPRLADHLADGGTLIAGGIVAPRAGEVEAALQSSGLEVAERREDAGWVTVRLVRPQRAPA